MNEKKVEKVEANIAVPRERRQFRALLLTNPNYFGNLAGSALTPAIDHKMRDRYEKIRCVGYQPQLRQISAVVEIAQPDGYSGGLCSRGSMEYVRFYMSFDGGATWRDQGLAGFTAYDLSAGHPLEYAVRVTAEPPAPPCADAKANVARVRAILSWDTPPPADTPEFPPVWGSVVDVDVELEPSREPQPIATLAKALVKSQIATLATLYKGKGVPEHRFLHDYIHKALTSASPATTALVHDVLKSKLGLEPKTVLDAALALSWDPRYEEVHCLGYDPVKDELSAVLKVKQPTGYASGPCGQGSLEHVAFWVDWGDGRFQYVGTRAVRVYDSAAIPRDGLEYAVTIRLGSEARRRPCHDGPVLARARAVLSWQTPPSTTNPDEPVRWGNYVEAGIHIPPGVAVSPGEIVPVISSVGAIPLFHGDGSRQIDDDGYIQDGVATTTLVPFDDAPFGGRIDIAGKIVGGTPATRYRVGARLAGSSASYTWLRNEPAGIPITITTVTGTTIRQRTPYIHSDADGWYMYEDYSSSHFVEGNLLTRWYTGAAEDGQKFEIILEVEGAAPTAPVVIHVDNTAPDATLSFEDPNIAAGVLCADYTQGDEIRFRFTASDRHFLTFAFDLRPSIPARGATLDTPGLVTHSYPDIADPGVTNHVATLSTAGMDPCGYSLTLKVWDRTNVNSGFTHNTTDARSLGFCVRAPGHT